MTEPESHTLAYLRRLDEKFDRLGSELGARLDRVEDRLGRIEDELLVLNGIVLRLEGARSRQRGSRRSSTGTSAGLPSSKISSKSEHDTMRISP